MKKNKLDIVCWWSGGVTSAVACYKAIELFGKERCTLIMTDTFNEHEDTYRFKLDCEKWYGLDIQVISTQDFEKLKEYKTIRDTWFKYNSLNTAHGAICSSVLKRMVREEWEILNTYTYQVFGFEAEASEFNRSWKMTKNHPNAKGIYPLLMFGLSKKDCLNIILEAGIKIPQMYILGFLNNNCFKTGCVQGGVGYWQKMKRDFPEKVKEMASIEHKLTDLKGEPVTMLKCQSNKSKLVVQQSGLKWKQFVFLEKHPDYPELKCLDEMDGREPESLVDCNGFCDIDAPNKSKSKIERISQLNIFEL